MGRSAILGDTCGRAQAPDVGEKSITVPAAFEKDRQGPEHQPKVFHRESFCRAGVDGLPGGGKGIVWAGTGQRTRRNSTERCRGESAVDRGKRRCDKNAVCVQPRISRTRNMCREASQNITFRKKKKKKLGKGILDLGNARKGEMSMCRTYKISHGKQSHLQRLTASVGSGKEIRQHVFTGSTGNVRFPLWNRVPVKAGVQATSGRAFDVNATGVDP